MKIKYGTMAAFILLYTGISSAVTYAIVRVARKNALRNAEESLKG